MDMLRQISFSDLCFSVMHFSMSFTRMINWWRSFCVRNNWKRKWESIFAQPAVGPEMNNEKRNKVQTLSDKTPNLMQIREILLFMACLRYL